MVAIQSKKAGWGQSGKRLVFEGDKDAGHIQNNLDEVEALLEGKSIINGTAALAMLAREFPDEARAYAPKLVTTLESEESDARVNAALAISSIAADDPDNLGMAVDPLISQLSHNDDRERAAAAQALANIATEDAVDALRTQKDSETNDEVLGAISRVENEFPEAEENLSKQPRSSSSPPNQSASSNGMIHNCPSCGYNLGGLSGIPRNCPGCGQSIKELL